MLSLNICDVLYTYGKHYISKNDTSGRLSPNALNIKYSYPLNQYKDETEIHSFIKYA